ncbi:hypothetical protein DID96_28530 [Burkholderia sp. Bp8963]|nr:hypothetical protein DID96_28530 [Burkholderia sp. Bp8963]
MQEMITAVLRRRRSISRIIYSRAAIACTRGFLNQTRNAVAISLRRLHKRMSTFQICCELNRFASLGLRSLCLQRFGSSFLNFGLPSQLFRVKHVEPDMNIELWGGQRNS